MCTSWLRAAGLLGSAKAIYFSHLDVLKAHSEAQPNLHPCIDEVSQNANRSFDLPRVVRLEATVTMNGLARIAHGRRSEISSAPHGEIAQIVSYKYRCDKYGLSVYCLLQQG